MLTSGVVAERAHVARLAAAASAAAAVAVIETGSDLSTQKGHIFVPLYGYETYRSTGTCLLVPVRETF